MCPEFIALLEELQGKSILSVSNVQKLRYMTNSERSARIQLLGMLDAVIENNGITAEQAQPYIDRLKIPKHQIDEMRALLPKYNFSGTKEAIGIALVCITMMITAPAVIIKSMRPAFVRSKSKI